MPGEWEAQSFIQFTLPHIETDWNPLLDQVLEAYKGLIKEIIDIVPVLLVHPDPESVRERFSTLPTEKLHWFQCLSNDTWTRDHGAISVYKDNEPQLLNFQFNGWGLKYPANYDNQISSNLMRAGVFQDTRMKTLGLVLEGGSIESDGKGTLLVTEKCLLNNNRNPHLSKHEISEKLKTHLGIQRVLWIQNGFLQGDDTDGHIDTLVRFGSPDTILYCKCSDEADSNYQSLYQMESELNAFKKIDGSPYNLIPLPLPSPLYGVNGNRLPATYANFLIINNGKRKKVIMPLYQQKEDQQAYESLRKAFKGWEIKGVNSDVFIQQNGSIHCLSMQYPRGINLNYNALN